MISHPTGQRTVVWKSDTSDIFVAKSVILISFIDIIGWANNMLTMLKFKPKLSKTSFDPVIWSLNFVKRIPRKFADSAVQTVNRRRSSDSGHGHSSTLLEQAVRQCHVSQFVVGFPAATETHCSSHGWRHHRSWGINILHTLRGQGVNASNKKYIV